MIKFDKSLYYYDAEAANFVIEFVEEFCTHVRGDKAGEPLLLADFWKEDIIKPVFGIKKRANGKRRFKTVYIEIGKGNAKSTVGSALALYLLGFDGSKGASVYSIATDTEQARIIFDNAKYMIEQSPYLKQYFEPFMYSIVKKGTPCSYKVLSGDAKGKHGLIPTAIIFDEVHEQRDRELWDTITAGQMKIDDSLTLAFTTAGRDKETICYELHKKALDITSGIVRDDSFYGKIYTAPEADDIADPKTWRKANPGLGTIISLENMQIEFNKVKASPAYENTFRRLHLNQWTDTYQAWITDADWMQCEGKVEDLEPYDCYGGLDLAATRDFNAFSLVFPVGEEVKTLNWYWLPKDRLDQRTENQVMNFRLWVKDGFIKVMPGSSADYQVILNDIREICEQYRVQSIAYDRKFAAPIVTALDDTVKMTPFDQSITTISYPTKHLDVLVAQKKLHHFGNPVLRWMVSNVAIYRDPNDNIKVVKHKSTDKVDGVVALIMALGELITYKMQKNVQSVYATRGILTYDEL